MKNQLVEISPETALSVFTADKGLDSYVKQVTDEVNCFKHDLTTAAGRARTISLASKVAKIKVKYDDCGKDLVSGWKENAKKVDKARKKMRDELDELKVLARKPVTDWEMEQERIESDRLARIESDMLKAKIESDHEIALLLNEKLDREITEENARIKSELAVESARLKQVQIDNDALIAREAKEKAEQLSKQAIIDAQLSEQRAIDDKLLADKQLLESQMRQKLLEEQAAQTKLNNEWLAYISEAYDHNNNLNAQAEQKRQSDLAEQSRLAAIETARLAQIKVQEDEKKAVDAAREKLEANQKHVGSVRGEIKSHLMAACGLDEATAEKVVLALLKTDRITINY